MTELSEEHMGVSRRCFAFLCLKITATTPIILACLLLALSSCKAGVQANTKPSDGIQGSQPKEKVTSPTQKDIYSKEDTLEGWEGKGSFLELGQWQVGSGLGFISGSPNGTNFAAIFRADYFLNKDASIGPMVLLVPPGDFSAVGGAIVGRYRIWESNQSVFGGNSGKLSLIPFIGLGGIHTEVKRNNTRTTDTSYYAPIGISLDYDDKESRFGISLTYMNNIYDIRTEEDGRDRSSSTFFFTLRFRPGEFYFRKE